MFSRVTGVVWLILILVQSDRERKKQKQKQDRSKTISVLAPPGLCRGLPFRDAETTANFKSISSEKVTIDVRM